VLDNAVACLTAGVPCLIGTTGLTDDGLSELDRLAREGGVPCLVVPNFAIGAVLMMRFAEQASRLMPHAEIVELHHETKVDAPSGTAKATAARMGGDVPIHSVRLPA
jgi:4-hydroxy-tetrahydrodipicolinate reductase